MDRRTRICIWIILIGLANFLAYTVLYAYVYGEAINGQVRLIVGQRRYFLQSGKEVSLWIFLYSGIHSISIWPTVGAVMLAMLTIAKDRIISSAYSTARRGRAMITLLAVVIAMTVVILTVLFTRNFIERFHHPVAPPQTQPAPASRPEAGNPAVTRIFAWCSAQRAGIQQPGAERSAALGAVAPPLAAAPAPRPAARVPDTHAARGRAGRAPAA